MSRIADNIRKYISCHQFEDEHYGEWGILTFKQRELIKELTETCNMFERTADEFGKANMKFKHQLALTEKALELACEEYSKLYCEHYCHREPCDECENGDYKFFKDNFLETAKEMMKSE